MGVSEHKPDHLPPLLSDGEVVRCRRCGRPPATCPCLTSPDAWDADKLPVTVLNSGVVVKVDRHGSDYRVSILLPPRRLKNKAERSNALEVADRWQRAIEDRCGHYHDARMLMIERGLRRTQTDESFARETNEQLLATGRLAIDAGESMERPGRWVCDLLQRLRPWFIKPGEPEKNAAELLALIRDGAESHHVPVNSQGEHWPVDIRRVGNRFNEARKRAEQARAWQGAPDRSRLVIPVEPYHLIEPREDWDAYLAELDAMAGEAWERHWGRRLEQPHEDE